MSLAMSWETAALKTEMAGYLVRHLGSTLDGKEAPMFSSANGI